MVIAKLLNKNIQHNKRCNRNFVKYLALYRKMMLFIKIFVMEQMKLFAFSFA